MTQITAVCDLGHSRKAKPNGICIHLAITCNEIAAAEIQNQQEIEMQKRQLGNSDLQITPVGYGAWAIGGSGWQFAWGSQSDNDSIAAIHRALELGVNWIDTAAVYGLGHSKEVVARALKEWSGRGLTCLPNAACAGMPKVRLAKFCAPTRFAAKLKIACAV